MKTNIGENQYREKPVQDFKGQLRNDFELRNDFKTRNDNTLSGERSVWECVINEEYMTNHQGNLHRRQGKLHQYMTGQVAPTVRAT